MQVQPNPRFHYAKSTSAITQYAANYIQMLSKNPFAKQAT